MNEVDRWTKANRLTEVVRHEIRETTVGGPLKPSSEALAANYSGLEQLEDGDPLWEVWITTKTGLDKERIGLTYFSSENAAKKAVQSLPVGRKIGNHYGYPKRLRDLFHSFPGDVSDGLRLMFRVADDDDADFHLYEALAGAGVHSERKFQTSSQVLEWVGDDHIAWMKQEFGENWTAVADFEYCLNHFPDSSLASLESKIFLARFITYDDFTAGYLMKEFEAIYGGTEGIALQSVEARRVAGEGGGKASRERRQANLEFVMQEIERLAHVVGLISEDRILGQAFESASELQPKMPKSSKTLEDYGTALRSEEPFKTRYEAVFRKST